MFQEMLNLVEIFIFVIQVHVISQNIFLMQNEIFMSFPTKIKNTFTENKKFISKKKFSNLKRYVDHTNIYLNLYQKPPGRNLRKEKNCHFHLF